MADKTGIEWTDATWNPVVGCTKVSPGCDHCYAERVTERFYGPGSFEQIQLKHDRLDQPLRWQKPRRIFVNSMSDLFHDDVSDQYIATVFAVMALAHRHTFQVLTKRPGRMRSLLTSKLFQSIYAFKLGYLSQQRHQFDTAPDVWPLPNVWLGVSTEDQKWADVRIPLLLDTPAAVRFISAEPLLGPIDLREIFLRLIKVDKQLSPITGTARLHRDVLHRISWDSGMQTRLDWVIAGGESGPNARPMHPDWVSSLRDQCDAAAVPFLFKQWGEWTPDRTIKHLDSRVAAVTFRPDGGRYRPTEPDMLFDPKMATMYRTGKKAAGRELDGRTWDQYPEEVLAR